MTIWWLAVLIWRAVADYGVVIESELEFSVVHVLKYQNADIQVLRSVSAPTNLSSLVTFTPLYAAAKTTLESEGVDYSEVPFLVVLAGFRQLALSSPSFIASIIEDLYENVAQENFALSDGWIFVPSGEEEAVMRWLGTNNTQQLPSSASPSPSPSLPSSSSSLVVVDVAETTVSVAFNMLQGVPLNGLFQVDVGKERHNFFVASYQGFGFGPSSQSIYGRYQAGLATQFPSTKDPCDGASAFSSCQDMVRNLDVLKLSVFCRSPPCPVNGIFTPQFPLDAEIVFSGYPYELVAFFLGNNSRISVSVDQVLLSASSICNGPLPVEDNLLNISGRKSTWPARASACFGAAWLGVFSSALGISHNHSLTFSADRSLAQGVFLERVIFSGQQNHTSVSVYFANCTRMAVVVDAGSSASKAKIYQWQEIEGAQVGRMALTALDTSLVKVKPGIASPLLSVDEAIYSLISLIEMVDEYIPAHMRSSTPIYVVATGGVRNLLSTDPLKALAIFDGIRTALANTEYFTHPSFVTWLSGEQEGAYAWLAARSLLSETDPEREVASVEVGGATLQIALEDRQSIVLSGAFVMNGVYDKKIELFSHSWNLYGRDEALRIHRELLLNASSDNTVYDPCQWTGFRYVGAANRTVEGRANMTACLEQVRHATLIAQTSQSAPECELPPCFSGVHLPQVPASSALQLLGIFRNVAEFFGLAQDVYLNKPVITRQWWENAVAMCNNLSYANLLVEGPQVRNPALDKPLDSYCHTAAQAYTIIVDLLRRNPDQPQDVSEMSEKISWALGYMVSALQSPSDLPLLSCPKPPSASPSEDSMLSWIYVGVGSSGALIIFILLLYLKRKLRFRAGREPMLSVQDQLAVN